MLRGNLSTRPFYNERGVHVLLAIAAVVLVALSVFSARQFLTLSRDQRELSARIGVDERRAEALRREAVQVRRGIDDTELQVTVAATREVNRAIDQRVFSWTGLFNTIERTIPPAVVLQAVFPTIDETGGVRVRLIVNAQRIEEVGAFMDALERAQTFRGLQSAEEIRIDDGSFVVTFDGQYVADGDMVAVVEDADMVSPTRVMTDMRVVLVPLVALALVNLVMLGLVLGPLGGRVGTLESRATAATIAAADAQRELDQARALSTGKSQATDDLQRFYQEVLPADQASARRLTFLRLAQLARGAGLDFDRRAFTQDQQKDAHLVRADLSMVVRGTYPELRRFMHAVEAGDDFVVVRGLTVGQSSDTPGVLEATLSLSTYYKAPDGR